MSSTDGKPAGGNRRRFYRVPARLPIRVCALDLPEAETIAREINLTMNDPPEIEDPGVAAAIRRVEYKLNRILSYLEPDRAPPLTAEHTQWISISGGGVGMPSDAAIDADGPVLVELALPESPMRQIRAVSHVVRSSHPARFNGSSESVDLFALSFDVIAPVDQEAIIRFSYEIQRVQLRERSVATDAAP